MMCVHPEWHTFLTGRSLLTTYQHLGTRVDVSSSATTNNSSKSKRVGVLAQPPAATLRRAGHCMPVVPALAALGNGFGIALLGGLAAENEYCSDVWILQL